MEQSLTSYWWIIIPLVIAFMLLIFSLERRGGRVKKVFPENYVAGLKALIGGDENTAFVKLKQAVGDDTDNIDAYLKLGDLFRGKGQFDKAIRIHRELLLRKNIAPEMASQVRQSLVVDYITTQKYDLALDVLEKLARDSSYRTWAEQRMLEVYERTSQWDKAFIISKGMLKTKDEQRKLAAYKYLIGFDLFNEGDFHKARVAFKDALHYDDLFADAYIMIAESYLAEDRKKDAVEFYKKLADKAPSEFYRVVDKIEETLFELGHFSDVEEIYKKILNDNPDEADILKSLAGIEEKKGNIRAAMDNLRQAVNAYPADGQASAKLLKLYLEKGEREKVYELLQIVKENCIFNPHHYACPRCKAQLPRPEIICSNCNRIGPYKKL